jgi:subtilisin family serine protease
MYTCGLTSSFALVACLASTGMAQQPLLPGAVQQPCVVHGVMHQIDPGWILLDPGSVSMSQVHELSLRWGLDAKYMMDSTVGRWIYMPVQGGGAHASTLDLVGRIAASGEVTFVSPVLLGGTAMLPWAPTADVLVQADSDDVIDAIAAAHSLQIIERDLGGLGFARLHSNLRSGLDMLLLQQQLLQRPDVGLAETNAIRWTKTAEIPNDPEFSAQWGMHQNSDIDIDAPEAWDVTYGSADIHVVVLDSGIDQVHPDINQLPGETFTGASDNGHPSNSCDNHGTAVSGCVSAIINNGQGVVGVAPGCKVRAGKVFNELEIFGICFGFLEFQDSWVVEGIGWAQSEGARVTNSSWGGGSASSSISAAFNQTWAQGVVHVAAAGNDSTPNIGWPANLSSMLAISAVQSNGQLASFSTYGNGLFAAAPGAGIRTTDRSGSDGYASGNTVTIDGTSFASPYVAGVVAMVLSMDDSLSPQEATDIIASTASDYGSGGWDVYFGAGMVNVAAAVAAADPGTQCSADINGDGMVGTDDILAVLAQWGPCSGCSADIDGDGEVGVNEILAILEAYGPC